MTYKLTFLIVGLILKLIRVSSISNLFIDWTLETPQDLPIEQFLLDYTPPFGKPGPNSNFPPNTLKTTINSTLPGAVYRVALSGILSDGSQVVILDKKIISSPEAPLLDYISASSTTANISYFRPDGDELSYYLEYYPAQAIDELDFTETKSNFVTLRHLQPKMEYRLRVMTVFRGVPSYDAIDTNFWTAKILSTTTTTTTTTSPASTTITTSTSPSTVKLKKTTSVSSSPSEEDRIDESTSSSTSKSTTTEESTSSSTSKTTSKPTTTEKSTPASPLPSTTEKTYTQPSPKSYKTTTTLSKTQKPSSTRSTFLESTTLDIPIKQTKTSKAIRSTTEHIDEYLPPTGVQPTVSEIRFETEGKLLRAEWTEPEEAKCGSYKMNYTVDSLGKLILFSVDVDKTHAQIELLKGTLITFQVFCLLDGNYNYAWKAEGVADLKKPEAIQNFRIAEMVTNHFFQSHIAVAWDWPEYHDFEKFTILLSYFPGTAKKRRKDILIDSEKKVVNFTNFKPAQLYTITIRNISQYDIGSTVKGIRQITPPVIESMLYPGKISSNAININFSPTSVQHSFDSYELIFKGKENKNISRKVSAGEDEYSFTFTGLVPGKSYEFVMYTVYKGVRSSPSTNKVTTYPLKVDRLLPIVGRDFVDLFWEISNVTLGSLKFRLAYNGNDGSSSSNVLVRNRLRHRFTNLSPNIWYTFTVIVLSNGAESPAESVTAVTLKSNTDVPTVIQVGSSRLLVKWRRNILSDINGGIKSFAVIVSQSPTASSPTYKLPTWREVQKFETWPPYQASPPDFYPFMTGYKGYSQLSEFEVGTEHCDPFKSRPYCNGRLKPETEYFVKIRVYTTSNITEETDYAVAQEYRAKGKDNKERKFRSRIHYLNKSQKSSFVILILFANITVLIVQYLFMYRY